MKEKKGYKKFNFIMKLISWCVMAILVVIGALLLTIVVLNKIADSKGELSPMGLYTIISPSMTPDIGVYDVVFVVRKNPEDIQIGDIISYYSTNAAFNEIPITHRVVEKFNTNTGISFRTKGDANQVVDNEIVMSERVLGTVRFKIPALGRIQFFLASKGGWFIAILVPAVGIIVYDIIKLVKLLSVKKKMEQNIKTNDKPKIKFLNNLKQRKTNESLIKDKYTKPQIEEKIKLTNNREKDNYFTESIEQKFKVKQTDKKDDLSNYINDLKENIRKDSRSERYKEKHRFKDDYYEKDRLDNKRKSSKF